MDMFNKVLKWVDHNRGLVAALILSVSIGVWFLGCQPTTQSLVTPEKEVTPQELQQEVAVIETGLRKRESVIRSQLEQLRADANAYQRQIEAAEADLARQYELRRQIIEYGGQLGIMLSEGTLTGPGAINFVVTAILALLSGGALYDNRRKDSKISQQKEEIGKIGKP